MEIRTSAGRSSWPTAVEPSAPSTPTTSTCSRPSPARPPPPPRTGDLPARLGGDEFAVLLDDAPDLGRALLIARRLVDTLQAPFSVEGRDVTMGASIGIASTNDRSERPDELLRNADVAMYTAKARGKAQFAVFEPAMQAAAVERHVMPDDPPRAPPNGEPILRYRPVVDL